MAFEKLNSKLILFLSLLLLFMFPIASAIVSHPASQVEPGSFQAGNYTFDGSIGIGTANPTQKLEVNGAILANGNNNMVGKGLYLYYTNSNESMIVSYDYPATTASPLGIYGQNISLGGFFGGAGVTAMTITAATGVSSPGNVGIGTIAPSAKLYVNDSGVPVIIERPLGGDLLQLYASNDGITAVKLAFSIKDTNGDAYSVARVIGQAEDRTAGSVDGFLAFNTRTNNVDTERMRIISTGMVGIGTTNPADLLHLYSSTDSIKGMVQSTKNGSNVGWRLSANSSGGIQEYAGIYLIPGETDATTYLSLAANDVTPQLIVTRGGNVGIGTEAVNRASTSSTPVLTMYGSAADKSPTIELVGNNVVTGTNSHGRIIFSNNNSGTNNVTGLIGVYRDAADDAGQMYFYVKPTGGAVATAMTIKSDGKVGIGTTTPTRDLHIQSSTPGIRFQDTDDNKNTTISMSGAGIYFDAADGGGFAFRNGSFNTNVIITAPGNVGIGTTSPTQTLHVQGNLNVTGTSYLGNIQIAADSITTNTIQSKDGNISFKNDSGNEVMRIQQNGKVGIGMSGSAYTLEILDNATTTNDMSYTLRLNRASNGTTADGFGTGIVFADKARSNNQGAVQTVWAGGMQYAQMDFLVRPNVGGGWSTTPVMTILGNGKVGIGTTTPQEKLQVQGQIFANISSSQAILAGLDNVNHQIAIGYNVDNKSYIQGYNGGSSVLALNPSGGSVGIGTWSPSTFFPFEVVKLGSDGGGMRITGEHPEYSFNETDTGKTWALQANGGDLEFWGPTGQHAVIQNTTGNVGIGTSNPGGKLDVRGTFDIWQEGTQVRHYNSSGAQLLYESLDSAGKIYDWKNGSAVSLLAINYSNGNVGIGTTSPTAKLEISATSGDLPLGSAASAIRLKVSNVVDGLGELQFSHVAGKVGASIGYRAQNGNGNTYGDIVLGVRNTFADTDLTEAMRITHSGNVGIGITNPLAALHVSSTYSSTMALEDPTNSARINMYGNNTPAGYTAEIYMYNGSSSVGQAAAWIMANKTANGGVLRLATSSNAAGSTFNTGLNINEAGKVGIGTIMPQVDLDLVNTKFGNANYTQLWLTTYQDGTGYPRIDFYRAKGTASAPTAVTDTIPLAAIAFNGYNGSSFIYGASISSYVDGSIGAGGYVPANLRFLTSNTSTIVERMRIDSSGNVGIGLSGPTSKLNVKSSAPGTNGGIKLTASDDTNQIAEISEKSGEAGTGYIALAKHNVNVTAVVLDGSGNSWFNSGGNVGIGTSDPKQILEVSSVLRLTPAASPPATCNANAQGSLYYDTTDLLCYCDGSAWYKVMDETTVCS